MYIYIYIVLLNLICVCVCIYIYKVQQNNNYEIGETCGGHYREEIFTHYMYKTRERKKLLRKICVDGGKKFYYNGS